MSMAESVKANPSSEIPPILAMCMDIRVRVKSTAEIQARHQVADEYGFIVVFPSAVHGCFAVKEEKSCHKQGYHGSDGVEYLALNLSFPDELRF